MNIINDACIIKDKGYYFAKLGCGVSTEAQKTVSDSVELIASGEVILGGMILSLIGVNSAGERMV